MMLGQVTCLSTGTLTTAVHDDDFQWFVPSLTTVEWKGYGRDAQPAPAAPSNGNVVIVVLHVKLLQEYFFFTTQTFGFIK